MKYELVLALAVFACLAVEVSAKKVMKYIYIPKILLQSFSSLLSNQHHKHEKVSKHPDADQRDIQDAIDVLLNDEADLNGECLTNKVIA